MGRRCVFGCANYRNLFPFPLDPCLRKKWVEFTHFEEGGLCPNSRICDRHFSEEVFDNLGMYTSGMAAHLRLSEDAIPSVYTVGASPPVKLSNMGCKCAYPECSSTEGLHFMPSNREVAHRWLHALGRVDIPSASVYVGNLHLTRECFSNYAEVEMGFKKQLLLNPDAVPTPAKVVTLVTAGSSSKIFPAVRHVACQTNLPEKLSVGTQVYLKTYFRSKGTQARVASRDCGMCTLTFPLDSPLLFLQPTIVKRPSKRPRLSLTDTEEGPSQCKLSVLVHEPEDST